MTTSDMIRLLCQKRNVCLAELVRCIAQTPQNFNKKLKRGTVSCKELITIAKVLNIGYQHVFVLSKNEKIGILYSN